MVPTDRQLVDSLLATILSVSKLIELVLGDERERVAQGHFVDMARIKSLAALERDFHVRALVMEYLLNIPKKN